MASDGELGLPGSFHADAYSDPNPDSHSDADRKPHADAHFDALT